MPSPIVKPTENYIVKEAPIKYSNSNKGISEENSENEENYVTAYNKRALYGSKLLVENLESSSNLTELLKTIVVSRDILSYKYNWDENGALQISAISFERATKFLCDYSNYLYTVYDKVLISPDIAPVRDGSIDLEWTLPSVSLLINFKEANGNIVYYYGDFSKNGVIQFDINGQLIIDSINEQFATYLTYLSKENNS